MGWHGNRKVSSVRSKNFVQIIYLINFFPPLLTSIRSLLTPTTITNPIPMNVGSRHSATISYSWVPHSLIRIWGIHVQPVRYDVIIYLLFYFIEFNKISLIINFNNILFISLIKNYFSHYSLWIVCRHPVSL